jgi:hypothetical protein
MRPVPSHSALKARLLVFGLIVGVIQGLRMQSPSSINGPLRWRDLEIGGAGRPKGASPDDPAEWIVPMEK